MRMRPGQVPEPPQASWLVGVMRRGLVIVPGLVSMPDLHDIQDARIIRLQHVNNSQPGATANHAQRTHFTGPPWRPSVRRAAGGTGVGRRR